MVSPSTRRLYSLLTHARSVVVGRGKTGWNKLLGKSAVAAIAIEKREKALRDATDLRLSDSNAVSERPWAQEAEMRRAVGDLGARRIVRGKGKEREYEIEDEEVFQEEEMLEEEDEGPMGGMLDGAGKFLLAGGLAGAGQCLSPDL